MWPHKALLLENCFPQATEECGGGGGCWIPRTLRTLPSWTTWGLLPPATSSLRPPLFGLWKWECCCWEKKSLWLFNSMAEKWKRGTSSLFFEEGRKETRSVCVTDGSAREWLIVCIYRGCRHSTMHGYLWEKMMFHDSRMKRWKLEIDHASDAHGSLKSVEQDGDGCTEGPYELRHKDVDWVWATVTTCNSLSIASTAIVFNSNCIQLYWPDLVTILACLDWGRERRSRVKYNRFSTKLTYF